MGARVPGADRVRRPQGVDALFAAMAELDPDSAPATRERMLTELRHAAGGQAALLALDDVPLPDEPFDWSVVPDDMRERTTRSSSGWTR